MKRVPGFIGLLMAAACLSTALVLAPGAVLAVENGGYANPQFLVTTEWLAQHLNDPDVKILDR